MGPKGGLAGLETKEVLTAVVLADSFAQRFWPITEERAKVLLPLLNTSMIDYTLEWLGAAHVEEVFVVCAAHAEQVAEHLEEQQWTTPRAGMKVTIIVSTACTSAGEALRLMDQKDCVKGDFLLVSGDVVASMNIDAALQEHRQRHAKDKNAIMTMVMRSVGDAAHRQRLGEGPLLVAMDPATKRLLKFEEQADGAAAAKSPSIDAHLFAETDVVQVRTDLLDCHCCICSPEVLILFSDNFDYQDIKRDFVAGVLSEEELGNKLYIYELTAEYAARVHNLRSYDAVARDLLQRWAFPYVPDTGVLSRGEAAAVAPCQYRDGDNYKDTSVLVSRTAQISHDTCIGAGTTIGDKSQIGSSFIGHNCRIGTNVDIWGCSIHDDVVIWDGAKLTSALVCDGVVVRPGATVEEGAVLSYNVEVAAKHTVPAYVRLTLNHQATTISSFDEELESHPADDPASTRRDSLDRASQADASSTTTTPAHATQGFHPDGWAHDDSRSIVGKAGAGHAWLPSDAIRPHVLETSLAAPRALRDPVEDASSVEGSVAAEEEQDEAHTLSPSHDTGFKREVSETLLRCKKMGFDQTNAIIELNGLKIAEDKTFADCARYLLITILGLCLPAPPSVRDEYRALYPASAPDINSKEGKAELLQRFSKQLTEWAALLQRFVRNDDDQVELVLTCEEYCGEEGEFAREQGAQFGSIFAQLLKELYDCEVVAEEALLAWADEKANASLEERAFLNKAAPLIQWLRTVDSEEDADSEEEEEEDDD